MNPQIAEFQRWVKTYLSWSHAHMDQIVADTVRKHAVHVRVVSPFDPMILSDLRRLTRESIIKSLFRPNPWFKEFDKIDGVDLKGKNNERRFITQMHAGVARDRPEE